MISDMKISIIGAGAMGSAVAEGWLKAGVAPSDLCISNPTPAKLERWTALGVRTTTDNVEAIRDADLIVTAVKPHVLRSVLSEITIATKAPLAIIVAGDVDMPFTHNACIMMPNTAAALCRSMTFMTPLYGDCTLALRAFAMLGEVMEIPASMLPAATALASCGIAYALRYLRAATSGGVEMGFRAADAQRIVALTMAGAAALASVPGAHAEAEIDKVTTPGGLTIRGLNAMEAAGFTPAVIAGLKASHKP